MRDKDESEGRAVLSAGEVPALILCGGAGTRLRAVLQGVPKALAPVAGVPFLDHVLEALRAAGIRKAVLCTGVHSEAMVRRYGGASPRGLAVHFSEEQQPLGTGGAVRQASGTLTAEEQTVLVLNGDTFLDIDFAAFLAQHQGTGAAITVALVRAADGSRYGSVAIDPHGRVTSFLEKPANRASAGLDESLLSAGWYLMQRAVLESIPPAPPAISLETEVLPQWIGRGWYGHRTNGFFIDIGIPEDLERAQREFASRGAATEVATGAVAHSR
jgi:NDP-sugar pyrophosphorylase family protein